MQGSYNSNWNGTFGPSPADREALELDRIFGSESNTWWGVNREGMDNMVLPVGECNNSSGVARREEKVSKEGQDLPTNEEKCESTNVGTETSPQDDDDQRLVQQIAFAFNVERIKKYLSDKLPNQSLQLSEKALFVQLDNAHVWDFRRYLLESHNLDLHDELKFVTSLSKDRYCRDADVWYHRWWIVEKLGPDYIREEFKFTKESILMDAYDGSAWYHIERLAVKLGTDAIVDVLEFTKDILRVDGKNNYPWRQRRSLLDRLGVDDKRASQEFRFLQEILKADARRYDAWYHRWWLIENFGTYTCAHDEFEFAESMIYLDEENDYAWSHRRWLAKKLESEGVMGELSFTRRILSANAENDSAWYHRKWVFKAFKVLDSHEPGFCEVLSDGIYNVSVWNQRLMAVTSFLESSSTDVKKPEVTSSLEVDCFTRAFLENPEYYKPFIRAAEIKYALRAIYSSPGNEYPWRYLRCLYMKSEFDVDKFEDICEIVLLIKADNDVDLKMGVIRERRKYVNALDTILELISRGYQPSYKMVDLITRLCQGLKENVSVDNSISAFFKGICLFLQCVDPMRASYWEWRTTVVLNQVYEFYDDGGENRRAGIESNGADLDSRWRKREEGQGSSMIDEKFERNRSPIFLRKCNCDQVVQKESFWSMPQRRILMDRETSDKKPEIAYNQRTEKADATNVPQVDGNAECSWAWEPWRREVERLNLDYNEELSFLGELAKSNTQDAYIWFHRQCVAQKLGASCARKELEFTEEILLADAKNEYAWSHRQWVFKTFGGWEDEIAFCHRILANDRSNGSVWNQILFITSRFWQESSQEEVDYAINSIMEEPENEYPWLYLGALHKKSKVDNRKLNSLFETLFKIEPTVTEDCLHGAHIFVKVKNFFLDKRNDLELNIIKNRRKYINALDTLMELMRHGNGYRTSTKFKYLMRRRCPVEDEYPSYVESLYSILQCADPLRIHYWEWRMDQVFARARRYKAFVF